MIASKIFYLRNLCNFRYRYSFNKIVDTCLKEFTPNLKGELIKCADPVDTAQYHNSIGRWIRNEFGLWHSNSLTANWRNNPDCRNMIDGIDHSKDHPDAISSAIICAIVIKLREDLKLSNEDFFKSHWEIINGYPALI